MAKYYKADTLIEFVKKYTPHIDGETTLQCVITAIENAPTADVEEVKHGEWELSKFVYGENMTEIPLEYTCSLCGKGVYFTKTKYCSNCGAKLGDTQ